MTYRLPLILTLIFIINVGCCFAQQYTLSGKITDIAGAKIPFASIYINATTQGTTSNIDGEYKLNLTTGKTELRVTSVGYEDRIVSVNIKAATNMDIILSSRIFTLKDVIIGTPNGNRADEIIRKTINLRKTYLTEVEAYTCDVYTKSTQKILKAPKKFFGRNVSTILELDSNRQGIIYLSETESKLDVKQKKIKEVMVSSKIAGDEKGFSFNKASDLDINFYNNVLFQEKLSVRGFISPVGENAFSYYRYKLIGQSEENGKIVYKIEVTPKSKNGPTFSGNIYIVDETWRVSAVNLVLTKKNGLSFIDSLTINQKLIEVENVYVPQSIQFNIAGSILGFEFNGYVLGVYKNYNVKPAFNKNFFGNEILKVEKLSNKKNQQYWEQNRMVPLTAEEKENYHVKDSINTLKLSQKYLDSVDYLKNKFSPLQILVTPYIYYRSYSKKLVAFDPLFTSIFYNTVEGTGLKYAVNWRKGFDDGRQYSIKPEVRYGFANRHFNANVKGKYLFDAIKNASISVGIGSEVVNLNENENTNLVRNSINALVFGKNIAKFYERKFINTTYSQEFAPSFSLSLRVDFAHRNALLNSSLESFSNNTEFTSNNPFEPKNETSLLFPNHKALNVSGTLSYTIAQKYITRPDGRFYIESDYPRIELNYRRGLNNILGSSTDYDFISVEIYQKSLHIAMLGKSSIFLGAGKFLTSKSLNYPDWKHFRANQSIIFNPDERYFQFLDFYQFNTTKQYFEAHIQHNFGGCIFDKIPLIKKLKLEEIIGAAYLSSPEKRNYNEFYFGVKRLNFRVHYGYAYDRDVLIKKGVKVSYGFNF
jgi:hypothetical protein